MPIDKLPQDDTNQHDRERILEERRKKFGYNTEIVAGVPIFESTDPDTTLPDELDPSLSWKTALVRGAIRMRRNLEKVIEENGYSFLEDIPQKNILELGQLFAAGDLPGIIAYCIPSVSPAVPSNRPASFDEYVSYFQSLDLPTDVDKILIDDDYFADSFLSGLNPVVIKKYKQLDSDFAVTDSHLEKTEGFDDDSLHQALAECRLYIVDFSQLAGATAGIHDTTKKPKFVYAPKLLLALPRGGGEI